MPIRVLATFPEILREIPSDLTVAADGPASITASKPAAAAIDLVDQPSRSAVSPAARPPRAIRPRASFPNASIAALAVVAAAIWSLIAIREAQRPPAAERDVRIAAEPAGPAEAARR